MKLEGQFVMPVPQDKVWEAFNRPEYLQQAMPGCEKMEEKEPGKYEFVVKVGISAIKGSYKGSFAIADAEPPRRTRLLGEGKGLAGHVKGEALIDLTQQEGGGTLISYAGDVQVGGLMAGVGQRMISGVARMMLEQFFKNMEKILLAKG